MYSFLKTLEEIRTRFCLSYLFYLLLTKFGGNKLKKQVFVKIGFDSNIHPNLSHDENTLRIWLAKIQPTSARDMTEYYGLFFKISRSWRMENRRELEVTGHGENHKNVAMQFSVKIVFIS